MDELAFLTATEQADLVRRGEVTSGRARRAVPRADRAARPGAERLRHRLQRVRRAARRAVPRRAAADQGPERDRRDPDDVLVACVRRLRARLRRGSRAAAQGRRLRRPRQDQHAGARDHGGDRVRAERRLPEPVGHVADARRLERRGRGGGRGRDVAGRARERRRRLDPHSGVVLRAVRDQARPRPRLAGAVGRARGLLDERPADPDGARRCCASRRDGRLRDRRSVVGAAARAPVRRGGRPRPGQAARRPDVLAADRRAGRSGVRGRRRGGRRAARRSSATTSRKRPRRGARTSCSGSSCRSGRSARR